MKRILVFLILIFLSLSYASASCSLSIQLRNQDPYPAVPGDYVKLVFQVDGIANPECTEVQFELIDDYPIHFDPGTSKIFSINSGGYSSDFSSFALVPYKVRVDENALDGDNEIKIRYMIGRTGTFYTKAFNLSVEDSRTDFEISVKDYNAVTSILTFEILNIGKNDVEALTVDIPTQKNIDVKGSRRNIVGSLDSNDDTTFSFEAKPRQGQIDVILSYNDQNNVRRSLEKSVMFDPQDFEGRVSSKKSNTGSYILAIIIAVVIAIWFWRRRVKKKKLDHLKHHSH